MCNEPIDLARSKAAPRRLHQGLISFGCMLVGWLTMLAYTFWRYSEHAGVSPRWHTMPVAITIGSARYVGPTWLLMVLPLFLFVRPAAAFWRLFLCVPVFAAAGLLIMATLTGFNYVYPWNLMWLLAAICGGSTGLASAIVQRFWMRRTQETEQSVS